MTYEWRQPTPTEMLDFFDEELERALLRRQAKGKGGQQVSDFSDFASVPTSGIIRLQRWSRDFRITLKAQEKEDARAQNHEGTAHEQDSEGLETEASVFDERSEF